MDNLENCLWGFGWLIAIAAIFCGTFVFHIIYSSLYRKFYNRAKKKDKIWESAFLRAMYTPVKVLVWLVAISYSADIAISHFQTDALKEVAKAFRMLGVTFSFIWFLIRFIKGVEQNLSKPKSSGQKMDATTVRAIGQLLRIATFVTGILIILPTLGIPISGIVAFGGVGGIAVGFASKDLLANFFGCLMVFLDRPFAIGDWIRIPEKDIQGTVEHIGWRTTRIRSFERRPLFVPNSLFTTASIENPSRMSNRRIKTDIGVRYGDATKVRKIVEDIEKMIQTHEDIDQGKTIMVHFVNFGPSSLDLNIYCFTKTVIWGEYRAVQQDVFLKCIDIITANGASCAFPTTTVHLHQ
ncbi:MAG: mechanosensitive ion channel family protein [Candidatus Algichlamydia australiensis]|nr:mechanosensitive ion channel family protein [Chlamydiales bacterium]